MRTLTKTVQLYGRGLTRGIKRRTATTGQTRQQLLKKMQKDRLAYEGINDNLHQAIRSLREQVVALKGHNALLTGCQAKNRSLVKGLKVLQKDAQAGARVTKQIGSDSSYWSGFCQALHRMQELLRTAEEKRDAEFARMMSHKPRLEEY